MQTIPLWFNAIGVFLFLSLPFISSPVDVSHLYTSSLTMTFKSHYKALAKELRQIARAAKVAEAAKDLERQKAVLGYKRLTALKQRQLTTAIDEEIKQLSSGKVPFKFDNSLLKQLAQNPSKISEKHGLNHFANIHTFLNSQRVYQELLERYNPGLTMTQEDNVLKSAAMVGLQVPKN